jgi:hemerythrin superfamily protein
MKATTLLQRQHRKVETLFKKLEKGGAGASALLDELANDLAAHMAIEQEIFYPAVQKVDPNLVLEALEEHALGEIALKRLMASDPKSPSWKARVIAARELIQHHVEEEEEELFPKVEKKIGEEKLLELGAQMKERFEEVQEQGFDAVVPEGCETTSADGAAKFLAGRPAA